MQGKGLVKFFLVIFTLVVAYQFLLIIPTRSVEKDAENFATQKVGENNPEGLAWREARLSYLDSINNEVVLDLFIKKYTYEELKGQQLALGLDLKGGMSVVMQVDLRDLVIALSRKSQDPNFVAAINGATEKLQSSQKDYITLFAEEFKRVAPDQKLASIFALNPDLRDKINYETPDGEVISIIRELGDETVDRTFEKVRKRIDKYGAIQPNITLDKSVNRIIVELPGIDNPERATGYLQATAVLHFFEVFRNTELNFNMQRANQALRGRESATAGFTDVDSTAMRFDSLGARIDSFYLANRDKIDSNSSLTNEGPLYRLLTPNNNNAYSQAVIGVAHPRDTAAITKMLATKDVTSNMPKDAIFYWGAAPVKDYSGTSIVATENHGLYAVKRANTESGAYLEGDKITDANENIDPGGNSAAYVVSLTMNSEGAKQWREMTRNNLKREVAIVLDKEVVSAPVVQSEIADGRTQISGDFNAQDALDLANILKVGKLPARTQIVESSVVGPSLGEENIQSGLMSLIVGVLLVLAFMVVYYGTGGIISVIALFANLFFILGSLASFGTVLTLPGIAGIVLTIGMAVDANVIIYERIREELRAGKSMLIAIKDGFQASYSAIIDANVTTILTAIVLNYFGQGPIKGFAIVLIIGVVCSLFSAVLVARLMIDWKSKDGGSMSFWTNMSKNAFSNMNIDFISKSKVTAVISTVIIVAGIGSMFVRNFDLGIDFNGGRSYTIQLDQDINIDKLRGDLTASFAGNAPLVKRFGANTNQVEITTDYLIKDRTDQADSIVLAGLYSGVETYTGTDYSKNTDVSIIKRSIKVGPTIADDIKQSAFYSTIFALLFIFLYILIRFRKWQYGLGAVGALFHDVLIVLGIFSLLHGVLPFPMQIDQAFIAAILTVVGYSINDTVVVFDRIREFFNTYTQKNKEEVINLAINNTISRTIITSLTTMFVVLMLFIFGGGTIKGFAFALLIGIVVGTYSSVFVATPIVNKLLTDAEIKRTVTKKRTEKKGYTRKAVPSVPKKEKEN